MIRGLLMSIRTNRYTKFSCYVSEMIVIFFDKIKNLLATFIGCAIKQHNIAKLRNVYTDIILFVIYNFVLYNMIKKSRIKYINISGYITIDYNKNIILHRKYTHLCI